MVRRKFVLFWIFIPAFIIGQSLYSSETLTVTFVGTGGPELTPQREGIATLVTAGEELILFDAGRNLMQNLYEAGVDPRDLDRIILTHLHNDHIEGLPTLWMTGWFLLGRTEPLEIWGPSGTRAMIDGMYEMFQFDIQNRANVFNDAADLIIKVTEFEEEGLIIQKSGLSVRAVEVEHDDGNPAYGFRVDYGNHSILFTGDTRLCSNLITYGKGVDLLVTNILAMPDELAEKPEMQGVVAKLMTIPEAVELFEKTQPHLGVYSHFVTKELHGDVDFQIERLTRAAGYRGKLFLAKDGWRIHLPSLEPLTPPSFEDLPRLDRKREYSDQ